LAYPLLLEAFNGLAGGFNWSYSLNAFGSGDLVGRGWESVISAFVFFLAQDEADLHG